MTRIDRAGRKQAILKVLVQQSKRSKNRWMTIGKIARRMGLKSSTYLKDLCWELINEVDGVMWTTQNGSFEVAWVKPEQMELPERYIVINNKSHKVASWVVSRKELANV